MDKYDIQRCGISGECRKQQHEIETLRHALKFEQKYVVEKLEEIASLRSRCTGLSRDWIVQKERGDKQTRRTLLMYEWMQLQRVCDLFVEHCPEAADWFKEKE